MAECHSFCIYFSLYSRYIHIAFIHKHSLRPISISSQLSAQWAEHPMGCRDEIRTRACLTTSQRAIKQASALSTSQRAINVKIVYGNFKSEKYRYKPRNLNKIVRSWIPLLVEVLPCGIHKGRILGRNPNKSLKSFPPCSHSYLYSFAMRFLFLQTHATSYSFYSSLLYTVNVKGGKPDRKPYPLPYGLRNPNRNLKSEISQDQKP